MERLEESTIPIEGAIFYEGDNMETVYVAQSVNEDQYQYEEQTTEPEEQQWEGTNEATNETQEHEEEEEAEEGESVQVNKRRFFLNIFRKNFCLERFFRIYDENSLHSLETGSNFPSRGRGWSIVFQGREWNAPTGIPHS